MSYIDKLTVSGTTYDLQDTSAQTSISALSTAFDIVNGVNLCDPSAVVSGYYVNPSDGQIGVSSSNAVTPYIAMTGNFTVSANARIGNYTTVRYAFYNSGKTFLSGGTLDPVTTASAITGRYSATATAPENAAYIRVSMTNTVWNGSYEIQIEQGSSNTAYYAYGYFDIALKESSMPDATTAQIDSADESIDNLNTKLRLSPNLFDKSTAVDGWIHDNVITNADTHITSDYIEVEPGATYYLSNNGVAAELRFIDFYTADHVYVSEQEQINYVTIPSGCYAVRFTTVATNTKAQFQKGSVTAYYPYNALGRIDDDEARITALENQHSSDHGTGYSSATADALTDGESITLPVVNLKKGYIISFSCKVSSFTELHLGRKTSSDAEYCTIIITRTNVNLQYYSSIGIAVVQNTHGLDLENATDLQIHAEFTAEGKAKLSLFADGQMYTNSDIQFTQEVGNCITPYAECITGSLTNCKLTFGSKDFQKSVWAFGDSSYGMVNNTRWMYYMLQEGFADCILISGFAGENTTDSLVALQSYLTNYANNPRYILWSVGGNDGGDSSSAPNATWMANTNTLIQLCETYNIEPVFCTIHSMDIPDVGLRSHAKKNEWIKASGYKYIDFVEAVDSQDDGTWHTGYCSSDGVHPTTEGAKALFCRAITDFPELTFNNNIGQ